MVQFANVAPEARLDGRLYCSSKLLPSAEGDLYNIGSSFSPDPVSVDYGQAVAAAVLLTPVGTILTDTSYVVLQTDLGDGNWFDVAWIVTTLIADPGLFWLSGGVDGANAFQQTRALGTAPSGHGSRQIPLGGRIRFVGKGTFTTSDSSSSSGPGTTPGVYCTIRYKLLGLR